MATLEALSSTELVNFIIYDTISATPFSYDNPHQYTNTSETTNNSFDDGSLQQLNNGGGSDGGAAAMEMLKNSSPSVLVGLESCTTQNNTQSLGIQGTSGGKKKRRRRPKMCKNKEEAESQRMTHIAVERNRRKQMNQHLDVLRSIMPLSYVQRGDQASIVGGAINYVKELEQMLQSLEAKKILSQPQQHRVETSENTTTTTTTTTMATGTPFAEFFTYPQYTCSSQFPNNSTTNSNINAIADIEVTLIESHANVRILCRRRRVRQLSKIISAFQTVLYLSILHLNVTTLDPLILYSISAKVEEGCQFNSGDEIANAIHHILRIIEEEAINDLCCQASM